MSLSNLLSPTWARTGQGQTVPDSSPLPPKQERSRVDRIDLPTLPISQLVSEQYMRKQERHVSMELNSQKLLSRRRPAQVHTFVPPEEQLGFNHHSPQIQQFVHPQTAKRSRMQQSPSQQRSVQQKYVNTPNNNVQKNDLPNNKLFNKPCHNINLWRNAASGAIYGKTCPTSYSTDTSTTRFYASPGSTRTFDSIEFTNYFTWNETSLPRRVI